MITVTVNDAPLQQKLHALEEGFGPSGLYKVLDQMGQDLVEGARQHIACGVDWVGMKLSVASVAGLPTYSNRSA